MGTSRDEPGARRASGVMHHRNLDDQADDLELTLPARAENGGVGGHGFGGLGDVLEVPDQTLSDIKLAVTEACTNVVVHAYPDGEGPLAVRARVDERMPTVV